MIILYILLGIILLGIASMDAHLRAIRSSNNEIAELLREQSKSR
ncbi:hypothetical protein [Paenibacillus pinihumi]|nr:hypothetical protein [Paenibacillus pinihumi]